MITLGDKGSEVSKLQKNLSMIGYDLVIDGCFGNKTLRSLKAFQKKYNLVVDGFAGAKTLSALKAAQKRTSKEDRENKYTKNYGDLSVDNSHHLDSEQYIKQIFDKDKIFIHYRLSGPDTKSVIKYRGENATGIPTAFIISGRGVEDGKIYETHNPNYWSYHLGIKGSKGVLDKHSIGIELCSWGRLSKRGDVYFNVYGAEVSSEDVYCLKDSCGDEIFYHTYTDRQMESLESLLAWIVKSYKILVQNIEFDKNWMKYSESLIKSKTPGIWTNVNVRKDKQDIYPDHRLFELLNRIKDSI